MRSNGDKGTSQALLDRAEGLDAPDDIKGAQEQVVLSFELRHDALEGIAAQLKGLSAGGKEADKAGKAIYTQMKVFSASDILYARAQDQIEQALTDNDVASTRACPTASSCPTIPTTSIRPSPRRALGGVATSSSGTASDAACKNDGETHGLGLVDGSTLLQPSRHRADQRRHRRGGQRRRRRSRSPSRTRATPTRATSTSTSRATAASRESGTIDEIAAGETQTVEDPARPRSRRPATASRSTSTSRPSAASRSPTTTRPATRSPSDRAPIRPPSDRARTWTRPSGSSRSPPRAPRCWRLLLCLILMVRLRRAAGRPEARPRRRAAPTSSHTRPGWRASSTSMEDTLDAETGRTRRPDRRRRGAGSTRRVSKTAVLRYDAFNETSGRQSSTVALLDDLDNGVVITAILQRDQARVYAKPIVGGRSEPRALARRSSPRWSRRVAARRAGRAVTMTPERRRDLRRPAGTFSEEALRLAAGDAHFEPVPMPTIHAAIVAVESGEAERALVPFENSIEGTVRPPSTRSPSTPSGSGSSASTTTRPPELIARAALELGAIETVLSHPQPLAQCARFLREQLPAPTARRVSSTAAAVRHASGESGAPWARARVRGRGRALRLRVLREGVEDEADNVTRFVWLAPAGSAQPPRTGAAWRTTLVFSELGEDHPGALVDALREFSEPRRST